MSSPAPSNGSSSSLTPPPSVLSPPSEPSPSPPPQKKQRKISTQRKSKKEKATHPKIILKLPLQPVKKKNKPREPKIEPIPKSVVNNFEVPLVVLFRSKFRVLFVGTTELGPQDVEEAIADDVELSGKLEEFILRICGLIGNRRKNVEYVVLRLN
jgi:hypothetical protein